MKSKSIFAVIAVLSFMLFQMVPPVSSAGHDMHSHSQGAAGSGPNPLVEEMIVLDEVFRNVVSAVALGEGEKVYRALESMHGTMEKTHKGGSMRGESKYPKTLTGKRNS